MKSFEEDVSDAITIAKTLGFGTSASVLDMQVAPGVSDPAEAAAYPCPDNREPGWNLWEFSPNYASNHRRTG